METTPHILIVDDEPRVLASLRLHLCRDYTVSSTSDPVEAVDWLRKGNTYDVVITDMRMPGMDGVELLKAARKLAPTTVRILLTGYANLQSAISAVNDGGVFRLLTKPCAPPVVMEAVADAVKQRQRELTARQVQNNVTQALRDSHAGAIAMHAGRELSNVATVYSSVLYMVRGAALSKTLIAKSDLDDLGWVETQIRKQAEQLLAIASADEETSTHVDMRLLLCDVAETLRDVSGFSEIEEDYRDIPKAYVVPAKARRVLTRLVAQAVDSAQSVPFGCVKIRLNYSTESSMVQCDIMDNGVGQASGKTLTNPDWLTNSPEAALDYAELQEIIEDQGGQIYHTSSTRRGTVYSILWPIAPRRTLADEITAAEPETITFMI